MQVAKLACHWYTIVVFGVHVAGMRPALDSALADEEVLGDPVCCCKSQVEKGSIDTTLIPIERHHCDAFKQIRPDRPFWFHDGMCCWTSKYFCTGTIGELLVGHDNSGDRAPADKCPASSADGSVRPPDPTMAYNRNVEYLETKIATMLVSNVVGFASGSAGSVHGSAKGTAGNTVVKTAKDISSGHKSGEAALGGIFEDLRGDLGVGQSSTITGVTGTGVHFGGTGLERASTVWKYNNGKISSDWMHVEYDETGNSFYVIQDPETYKPEENGCHRLKQGLGHVCIVPDIDKRGFHMKAEVDLTKEVPS